MTSPHGMGAAAPLDLYWDGRSRWMQVAGRPMPAQPIARDDAEEDCGWAAGVPMENGSALLVVVDDDGDGHARAATARLVIPAPEPGWSIAFEATPCVVWSRRIHPCSGPHMGPPEWEWAVSDGWWAQIDDARELWRYAALFGCLPVAR